MLTGMAFDALVLSKTSLKNFSLCWMIGGEGETCVSDVCSCQFSRTVNFMVERAGTRSLRRSSVWRFVQEYPFMLDVESFEAAVVEAKRLRPGLDIAKAMNDSPAFIFGFQRREHQIPYDSWSSSPFLSACISVFLSFFTRALQNSPKQRASRFTNSSMSFGCAPCAHSNRPRLFSALHLHEWDEDSILSKTGRKGGAQT
jgi:hypothetical protein